MLGADRHSSDPIGARSLPITRNSVISRSARSPRHGSTSSTQTFDAAVECDNERGQIETLWVVDLDGTVVVIATELWPGPTAAAHPDFADAVLDSIRIERT